MIYSTETAVEFEEYKNVRCDEVRNMYDGLKLKIMQLSTETDELAKFDLLGDIAEMIKGITFEHVDTLDRYLYAYRENGKLEEKIETLLES